MHCNYCSEAARENAYQIYLAEKSNSALVDIKIKITKYAKNADELTRGTLEELK